MSKRYLGRPSSVLWIISLLLVGLILTACSGAAQPTAEVSTEAAEAEVSTEAAETEASADTSPDTSGTEVAVEEPTPEEQQPAAEQDPTIEVETPTVSAEADDETASAATHSNADCQAADPNEDPIAGAIEFISEYIDTNITNDGISAVSGSDWVKGPDDAPVTIIEYGDFQ